jgi:hypothetical protein
VASRANERKAFQKAGVIGGKYTVFTRLDFFLFIH